MALIEENEIGALGSWVSTLLQQCQGGCRRAAQTAARGCKSTENRELLRDFAIHILQELEVLDPLPLSPLEKARKMAMPYSPSYNAEDHERLFHTLDSLLKPDVHHSENRACRSARALWSPLRADRLLWAKQAWEHPDIDFKVSSSNSGTELVHFNASTMPLRVTTGRDKGRASNTKARRSLSKWINKWCNAFEVPPDQWILILPSPDLCGRELGPFSYNNSTNRNNNNNKEDDQLLPQLVTLQWDWLLKTLRTALVEWRLDAMFPTLVHPIIHDHWKVKKEQEPNTIVMQCIVFIARVYCAMKELQWDSMESPVLLTKVLRCATLLQEEASVVFQQVDMKVLASYPRIVLPVDRVIGTTTTNRIILETTGHGMTMVAHGEPPMRRESAPTPAIPSQVPVSVDVTCQKQEEVLFLRKRKREDSIFADTPAPTKVTKRERS